jgi:hypothetical protein
MTESFKEWLKNEELNEQGLTRRKLLSGGAAALVGALGLNKAMGANTSANSPGVTAPEDSVGMIPQIRNWSDRDGTFSKQGHLESLDKSFAYIRFTDSPDKLTRIPRSWLSDEDREYLSMFEQGRRTHPAGDAQVQNGPSTVQQGQAEKKPFNPKFGPKPPTKNPTPMQVYRHQVRIARDGAYQVSLGKKPPVDYLILYRYYNGIMPDPPEDE